ncbi:MAG: hypothetical protein QXS85_01755 [Acidilobaceae archaeon]
MRRELAEKAIGVLRRENVINASLKIKRVEGFIVIPVLDAERAVRALAEAGVEAELAEEEFETAPQKPRPLSEVSPRVSSFSLVGDIAVFSWRSGVELEEYELAARELLRQQPRVKAAFLKTETWGELRVQKLVHLAGENRTVTAHREYGLVFHVDIARVYFNPRLSTEHRRIAEESSGDDIVLDMFAGVGGYAIHIASLKPARVVASDLNEIAVYYLAKNVAANKRALRGSVTPLRLDASLAPLVLKPVFTRLILDHPTASRYFVGEACRLAARDAIVHVYVRAASCREALEDLYSRLARCCRRVEELYCREVLEYAPGVSVYNATFSASGLQA